MFHYRLQQYECDQCGTFVPRSQPVRFADGKVFCSPECMNDYLDAKEEDQIWREAEEHMHYQHDCDDSHVITGDYHD